MKLSCDEATEICDKAQYGEVTIWERIKLSVHLFLCKKCGLYTKQNGIMTKCYQNNSEIEKHKKCCLSLNEKECMEKNLKENK